MKKIFILFILFIIAQTGFTQETVQLTCFDNLNITVNIIKDTEYTSEKYEQGWSLTFSEKNKLFQMVITLYPFDKEAFKIEDIKKELAAEGAKLLVQSEEKELVINDYLNNSALAGYYYMLTDKNPKEGEFKYLVQGLIKYNNVAGFYTFLHNSKDDKNIFTDINIHNLIIDAPSMNQTKNFENVKLTESDIKGYKLQFIKNFYSMQQASFYNKTDIHESILSKLEEKYTQSISSNEEQGTVFYYYFKDKLDSARTGFLKGLFYGDSGKPSKEHPEIIIIRGNYLIVFSYPYNSKIADGLLKKIKGRLK